MPLRSSLLDGIKIFTDHFTAANLLNLQVTVSILRPLRKKITLCQRNPDYCFVSRSERIAIYVGLEAIEKNVDHLWISSEAVVHSDFLLIGFS